MSEGIDQAGSPSGASTPTSPFFDPGASEFVPDRTPATDGRTTSGQLRASFNTTASGRKPVRPGLALFSTSTWSPTSDPPVRSAGIPPKSSWDSFTGRNGGLNGQSKASPTTPGFNTSASPGHYLNSPLSGRGFASSFGDAGRDGQLSAKISPGPSSIRYTQTEEYHNSPVFSPQSAPHESFLSRTAHLPQGPFCQSERKAPASSSGGSNTGQWPPVPGTPNSSASSFATQAFNEQNSSDEQTSPASGSVAISDHYTKTHPELAGSKAEVWSERQHPHGLRRALKDQDADWEAAYEGSLSVLTYMNPETYQMPFGTRVINIKTEYPRNILISIKTGKYSVMASVAERIMTVWEARGSSSEKVIFLFSINGSKKFCGAAEMSSEWNREVDMPDWEQNPTSKPCVGHIPVVWVFAKDVSYHQFLHIRQPQSSNPVGNMWNGMNFPSDTGRQVMHTYVQAPATSSILGLPRAYRENDGLPPPSIYNQRGGFNPRNHRGGRGTSRAGARGGHAMTQHWRQRDDVGLSAQDAESDADQTPTAATFPDKRFNAARMGPPPKFKSNPREGQTFGSIKQGQKLSVIVNDQGEFEVVGVESIPQGQAGSSLPAGAIKMELPSQTARGGMKGVVHGARSLGSLHQSFSSTATLRAQNEPATQRIHPAASAGNEPGQSGGLQSPEAMFAMSPTGFGFVPPTPTHRPSSRASRRADNPGAEEVEVSAANVNALRARFHALAADQYSAQAQLDQPETTEANSRFLITKIARVDSEKRRIQAQLVAMGIHLETTSPTTRNSFSSTEPESESSGSVDISPVRAEDGRRLRSVSKLDSPFHTMEGGKFDKAPGGSERRKRQEAKKSSELQKKSIMDLLDSPKMTATPARRPALNNSALFSEDGISPCERRVLKIPTPRGTGVNESTSPNAFQSSGFPGSADVSDQDSSNAGARLDS
ncbi:hypothetical protein PRZ48_006215 [Zasmidium cellare]|uniref:YTH domain-containing protein n=1 Tax=Zasmidium cellare TaxID=395010 RepID=A0ABR0EMG0_ZASCE|nr:hypothetical protein PRZ48_006215 [Zasmidium cellare]